MRAVQFIGPRKIVLLDDAPEPKRQDGEVLVRCRYVAVCGTNMGPYLGEGRWERLQPDSPPGWLGHENIGHVVESDLPDWPVGTPVLAHPEDYNGFAELLRAKPRGLARLPAELPDLAAMIVAQPLSTVLRALVRTGPVINQDCAVVGQGPMGLIFTHLLGRMGARQVIGIDPVGWRLPWAERFGATTVIDASKQDALAAVRGLTGGRGVDFCVEAVGHVDSLDLAVRLPRRQGRLFVFGVPHHECQEFPWYYTLGNETEIITSMGPECTDYFQLAVDMIVQGRVDLTPMVTPRLPWNKAPEAFEMYADPANAEGSLKLTLVF